MSRTQSMATLFAVTATLVLSLLAVSPALAATNSLFHLRVGPGVTATATTGTMRASCGDDARCQFDVPAHSSFEVVAQASRGAPLRWTGCAAVLEANRCRVEVGSEPVLITVR